MRLVLVILLIVVAVVLAVQNADVVAINVLWWELRASLAVIIVTGLALGALTALLALAPKLYRQRKSERSLRARIVTLEGGNGAARAVVSEPVNDRHIAGV